MERTLYSGELIMMTSKLTYLPLRPGIICVIKEVRLYLDMPFMVWLAFRDRLSTGDRMKNWEYISTYL
uniref:Uncharacterized protein n=1 Tax=Brassica oleracea TaxID=3712 RepID=A0A3P6ECJ2_BRAOL|nr:unnamed protein product [Brassica oleracea]